MYTLFLLRLLHPLVSGPGGVNKSLRVLIRFKSSSASSSVWVARQARDVYRREALVQGLKSRAAFKLLELNAKHRLFSPGATVVDLGYAPGSWSQVAIDRTRPQGRVIGVDLIPAQPPRGVSTIQGNFLSEQVQEQVRAYVRDPLLGMMRQQRASSREDEDEDYEDDEDGPDEAEVGEDGDRIVSQDTRHVNSQVDDAPGYIDMERAAPLDTFTRSSIGGVAGNEQSIKAIGQTSRKATPLKERDLKAGRVVDVILSDMFAPWPQTSGFSKNSINDVYSRLMNTSGNGFRDHVKSMDLCIAALAFAFETLKTGGHFVCKYYQGAEEKDVETRLKKLFERVHREKPEASRKESREGYFVGLRRKEAATREQVLG